MSLWHRYRSSVITGYLVAAGLSLLAMVSLGALGVLDDAALFWLPLVIAAGAASCAIAGAWLSIAVGDRALTRPPGQRIMLGSVGAGAGTLIPVIIAATIAPGLWQLWLTAGLLGTLLTMFAAAVALGRDERRLVR